MTGNQQLWKIRLDTCRSSSPLHKGKPKEHWKKTMSSRLKLHTSDVQNERLKTWCKLVILTKKTLRGR